jgi:hypothetical protein
VSGQDSSVDGESLSLTTVPVNKCRTNDQIQKLPFAFPNEATGSATITNEVQD